jgi:hypothetical protein
VIDVTGDAEVHRTIYQLKAPTTEVMGGLGARFMWDLVRVAPMTTAVRAIVLAPEDSVDAAHLPIYLQDPPGASASLAGGLHVARERVAREFERQAVVRVLRQSRGNVSEAARIAKTTRRNLHRLLVRYRIDPAPFRGDGPASRA